MNKIERSKVIKEILDELYPSVPIPLNHSDPFTLLVAVLLSAQCTDERVNLVTPALFKIGPTPEEMAKKSISEIHHCIRTCGLANTKAKFSKLIPTDSKSGWSIAIPECKEFKAEKKSFIAYRIFVTNPNIQNIDMKTYSIYRRYSEFDELVKKLKINKWHNTV